MTTSPVRARALFDALSENTGDRAIGLAVDQEFGRHGIAAVEILDPLQPHPAPEGPLVVVGGGDLIRPLGDRFYDRFRLTGPAVLNAVGVWPEADHLDYLREYPYVSARTSREAETFSSAGIPDVHVLPCTTTNLESPDFTVPGLEPDGEPVVGIHVVPHTLDLCPELIETVNAIPHRKIFIPFTHYNDDDSFMRELPFDRSRAIDLPRLEPLELHAVLRRMTYVVISSLHATIFSYSQGVPFATVEQRKVSHYLADRGLGDLVFRSDAELRGIIDRLEQEPPSFHDLVAKDRTAIQEAFAGFAELARARGEQAGATRPPSAPPTIGQDVGLVADQRGEVIRGRDRSLGLVARRATAEASLAGERRQRLEQVEAAEAEASRRAATAEAEQRRLAAELAALHGLPGAAKNLARSVGSRVARAGRAARDRVSRREPTR